MRISVLKEIVPTHGTMTFANGDKYVGEFKDHKANGQGTPTLSNGRIERGIWKNNKIGKLLE